MAPYSSTIAWKIPWMEKPGGLQSMGSLRVGHNWATSLSLSLSCIGEGHGTPLQCSCLENPRDGGARWAAVYGVAQSQTWLKQLSSSSSSQYSCLENTIDRGAWQATVHGIAKSQTQLSDYHSLKKILLIFFLVNHLYGKKQIYERKQNFKLCVQNLIK